MINFITGIESTSAALQAERVRMAVASQKNANANTTRGLDWLPEGDLVMYGEGGVAVRLTRAGLTVGFPRPDPHASLSGCWIDPVTETLIVVGERGSSAGIERSPGSAGNFNWPIRRPSARRNALATSATLKPSAHTDAPCMPS